MKSNVQSLSLKEGFLGTTLYNYCKLENHQGICWDTYEMPSKYMQAYVTLHIGGQHLLIVILWPKHKP